MKIYSAIEEAYLNDNYDKVIQAWESRSGSNIYHSLSEDYERNLLQALIKSYSEVEYYSKSNKYVNIFILKLQKEQHLPSNDIVDDLNFCFLAKTSNLEKQKKRRKEYKALFQYVKMGGKKEILINRYKLLESNLFQRFRRFNLYFSIVFVFIVLLNRLLSIYGKGINHWFMLILSIIGVLWISLNIISRKLSLHILRNILTIV